MSTSAVTLRWPQRASRSTIHCGVFALVFDVAHDAAGEAAAQVGRRDLDLQLARRGPACTGAKLGLLQRRAGQRRQFARDAEHAQGVRQVGRELEREERVVQLQHLAHVGADAAHRPPVRAGRRGPRSACSSRAEHSMPWLSTPRSLPSLIWNGLPSSPGGSSAPTSAQGTLMPARALGAPQTMLSRAPCPTSTWHTRRRSAFGMLHGFLDLADHDPGERRRDRAQFFHLQPAHGERVGQLLRGQRRVAEFAQPGLGELHVVLRSRVG